MNTLKNELLIKLKDFTNLIEQIENNTSIDEIKKEMDFLYSFIPNIQAGNYITCLKKSKLQKLTIGKSYKVKDTWCWKNPYRTAVQIFNDSGTPLTIHFFKIRFLNKEWNLTECSDNKTILRNKLISYHIK